MEQIKIGVVGLGKMGLLHTSILSTIDKARVVVVCDKNNRIINFARKMLADKIKAVDDIKLLSEYDLDAIYITTPISSHFSLINLVYDEKIAANIFTEKTLAFDADDAEEICRLARSSGGINMVGYQRRFAVTFGKARQLLDEGAIGEPTSFWVYAYSSDFLKPIGKGAGTASALRGGLLRDLGSHAIDVALWYFRDLDVISHDVEITIENGFEEAVRFGVQVNDSLHGNIEASWCKEGFRTPEVGMTIDGTGGSILVNDDKIEMSRGEKTMRTWYRQDFNDNVGFLLGSPEYFREDDYFIKCLTNEDNPLPNFSKAAKVDAIIEKADQKKC